MLKEDDPPLDPPPPLGLFISVGQVIAPDAQGVQLLVMSLIMILVRTN